MFENTFNPKRQSIVGAVIAFFLGLLFVVIPYETLKDMIFTFIGIGIIVINLVPCIIYWTGAQRDNNMIFPAILSTISVVIGFIFIFWHHWIVSIVLAVWLIVMPIVRIAQAKDKLERFKKEIPLFIIAILLFFVPAEAILEIVLKVFGGIVMLLSAIDIIYIMVKNRSKNDNDDNENNTRNPQNQERVIIDAEVKDIE